MALRIAVDLDGTLAAMDGTLQRAAEELFGSGVDVCAGGAPIPVATAGSPAAVDAEPPRRALTSRETRVLWEHVRAIENFWTTLAEVEPGAVARLAAASATHGWEVIFLTQRPPTRGATAQLQSQRWLHAHGFEFPAVFVMNGSRGKAADALALHALVDDRQENCLDIVADSKARPILICRGRQPAPPSAPALGITVAASMAEALRHLEAMTAARSTTFSARLHRALRAVAFNGVRDR